MMKGKTMKKILSLIALIALAVLCFSACKADSVYTVTFDADNGDTVTSVTVAEGETASIPAAPSRTGFDFVGWYLGDEEYNFSAPVNSDVSLVAKWVPSINIATLAGKWTGTESVSGSEYRYELVISASGTVSLSYYRENAETVVDITKASSVKGKFIRVEYSEAGESKSIDFLVSDTLSTVGFGGGELVLSKTETYVVTYHTVSGEVMNVTVCEGDVFSHPEESLSDDLVLDGWYTADGVACENGALVSGSVELYPSVYTAGIEVVGDTVTGYSGSSMLVQTPDYHKGVKVTKIGERAFFGKEILTVKLPSGIEEIGNEAFRGCVSLLSPDLKGVVNIGEYAFFDCNNFTSLTIPGSVETIGKGAFGSTLIYSESAGYSLLSAASSSLASIELPFVGGSAEENTFLSYIFGADSYDSIFFDSEGKEMTVDGEKKTVNMVNYIPDALKTVRVVGCQDVPDYAFYSCFYIENINFPAGIKSVGKSSFEACYVMALDGIESVERIDDRAFFGSAFLGTNMKQLTYIGDMAFANTEIMTIRLYPELKYIGEAAFAYTDLSEITIPQSVEEIGDMAFFGCSRLESVSFEASVPCSVGGTLFAVVEGDVAYYSDVKIWVPDGDAYKLYREKVNLRDYASGIYPESVKGQSGYIVLDGVLLGYIGDEIDTVSVPDGTVEIANFAFYNCLAITDVVMPEGFKRIGKYAFYNCTAVQNLYIPSTLVEIDDYAFTGFFVGNNISRLYLPEGFKRIGDGAFLSSFNLKIVELPSTLEYIGYLAFGMSNSLERMYFSSPTPPTVGSYENDVGEVYREIFSIINAGKTVIYVPSGRNGGQSILDTYRATDGFVQYADYVKALPNGKEVGHYGNGSIFIDLDGCDTATLSILTESENDTTDFGGSKYELAKLVGTYTLTGTSLQMELPEYGTVSAVYSNRTISLTLNGESCRLVEPRYYYDSYNWTNFRLYAETDTLGKGLFDMYGSFLTPFDWKIAGADIYIAIDGNNKLPENSEYAGVVQYKGAYNAAADSFTVSFMLNDYDEIMNFSCERNDVVYATGEASRLYGTYKVFAENGYEMFTLYSKGDGIVDVYIGESLYKDCKYTMEDGVLTIDVMTMKQVFTMTKDGHLVGKLFGVDCYFVYVDDLMDSTKLPGRDDAA